MAPEYGRTGFPTLAFGVGWAHETGDTIRLVETDIRNFLSEVFFLGDDPQDLPGSSSLIESGVIDSTGVMELVGFLEDHYSIRIEDGELVPENLDSIDNIVGFVGRKMAAVA
jgi:acyl carrier protein